MGGSNYVYDNGISCDEGSNVVSTLYVPIFLLSKFVSYSVI